MDEAFNVVTGELSGEVLDDDGTQLQAGWRIRDISEADWALKRIAEAERQVEQNEMMKAAEVHRAEKRLAKINERPLKDAAFFRAHLEAWANEHRAELLTGKSKTRKLLNGALSWRKTGGGLKVIDVAALLRWADGRPEVDYLFRTKKEPVVSALNQLLAAPPGCERTEESEKLTISTEEG